MPDDDLLQRPSLDQKEEVQKFLLAVVARFKAFKKRVPSMSSVGKRPQRSSASKGKSSVMSSFWVWRMLSSMCRLYYLRATGKAHRTQVREWMGGWSDQGFDKKGPYAGKFSVKYKDDPSWWTHSLLCEGYGKDKHWVLLGLPSRDSA